MIIKDKYKIGAHELTVETSKEPYIHPVTGERCMGLCDSKMNKLSIQIEMDGKPFPESIIADTLLHEATHFGSGNYGIGLDENQVLGVTGFLLAFIRDNDIDFRLPKEEKEEKEVRDGSKTRKPRGKKAAALPTLPE
jgi:hypothetical protein